MSVFNASRLLGKTVVITGASAGIGAATAVLFAKGGANVVLLARRAEALQKVVAECSAAHKAAGVAEGGKFAAIQLDVSDKAQVAGLLDKIPSELRDVDVLVNNAGFVHGREQVGDIAEPDIEAMFATNVFGLIAMTQLFVREFKARNKGHVINLGSVAGREPYVGGEFICYPLVNPSLIQLSAGSIYCATKHALRAFTGSLMRELVSTPIRVTKVQPGMVETEFSIVRFRGDKAAADKVYEGLDPLVAQDIAEEIVWAASRPPHVNIAEIYVLPTNQASAIIAHRR
ncbi:NAD(P)-binding protein [Punctularia strigosozonata HHB-11173 SS5]|uniref:NAD(P)-binding protein n=1 Tax=Punctularia strigosozonata (strain HHB-11173) TaxID=741275 RepID=UPI0004416825|nr:NAD(P)-binding protein [Punctularia strigosozonata HHB-11173 SS5]EIN08393.1 NAD(P)-binding protein [Punctularia strigosozonata HHB-11173 SS5]